MWQGCNMLLVVVAVVAVVVVGKGKVAVLP